jgi:hypothetical protein
MRFVIFVVFVSGLLGCVEVPEIGPEPQTSGRAVAAPAPTSSRALSARDQVCLEMLPQMPGICAGQPTEADRIKCLGKLAEMQAACLAR